MVMEICDFFIEFVDLCVDFDVFLSEFHDFFHFLELVKIIRDFLDLQKNVKISHL